MLERDRKSDANLLLGTELPQSYADVVSLLENPDANIGAKWMAYSFIISNQLMQDKYPLIAAKAAKLEKILYEAIIEQGNSNLLFKDLIDQKARGGRNANLTKASD